MNKKKKKIPGYQPNQYPFGGLINQGVTGIAKALGANDKNAQIWGSAVSTATGFIPGMQDNFLQAGDLIGDTAQLSKNKDVQMAGDLIRTGTNVASMFIDPSALAGETAAKGLGSMLGNIQMADGGDLIKVKYNRLADKTSGDLQVSKEDLKYLKKYNEAVKEIQAKHPEIFGTKKAKASYQAEDQIDQTAGIQSGGANADYVVNRALTDLKDDSELAQYSPYLYDAGYTTIKDQKDLLDNVYRILGKDIISNDYRAGLRHMVTFDYEEPEIPKKVEETLNPSGQQNTYSQNLAKTFTTDIDAEGIDLGTAKGRTEAAKRKKSNVVTEEGKTMGRRNESQVLNPNWTGEFTTNPQGTTNTVNIEDPELNVLKKEQKALGGKLKYIYAMGGEPIFKFEDVNDAPILNSNTGLFNTPEDKAKAEKMGYKLDNLLLYHQDPNNLKSVTMDPYNNPEQLESAQNKLINKVFSAGKPIQYKYAMGGDLTNEIIHAPELGGYFKKKN